MEVRPAVSAHPVLTQQLLQRLRRVAGQYLDDEASAQDVAQAAAEALLVQRGPYLARSAYTAYALAVLRHKIADELRWRRRQTAPGAGCAAPVARGWTELTQPEHRTQQRQSLGALARKLAAMPPATRKVLLLAALYGYPSQEISLRTGISTGAIWVMLHRSRKRLREQLRHLEP